LEVCASDLGILGSFEVTFKFFNTDLHQEKSVSKETSTARKEAVHVKILAVKCLKVAVVFGKCGRGLLPLPGNTDYMYSNKSLLCYRI
jgi:hypothetical protein